MLLRKFLTGGSASSSSLSSLPTRLLSSFLLFSALGGLPAQASDILQTNGFSTCMNSDYIDVTTMDVVYNRATNYVTLDIAGTSKQEQKITLSLTVSAYGKQVYSKTIDPCDENIEHLCPISKGAFAVNQQLTVPSSYASMIPSIAFQIPDLDGLAQLQIISDDNTEIACLQSSVANGKTAAQAGVKWVTGAIAAGALAVSGASAVSAAGAGAGGAAGPSPNFGDVMVWFQGVAMNGMLTVNYPKVYRSFTDNFAWSTGIISWESMQRNIDNFRKSTGGNLTDNSIEWLLNNVTLVYNSSTATTSSSSSKARRALDATLNDVFQRDISLFERDDSNSTNSTAKSKVMAYVHGIQAKVETLKVPSANTFMTVLEIFCIVIAAIAVCILLLKVILEVWAMFASFPKALTGFRKRYWEFLATTIVRIVLILYGTWTLYCLYQFSHGDSWGAHVLAAITLVIFSSILGFFIWKIASLARRHKNAAENAQNSGPEELFAHKAHLRKYGMFYDQYKADFWWVFVPLILYAFAKGAFIALGDGHGLIQTIGQAICELFLLILLVWNRPYNTKAGNVLNICISVVRVLSVICLIIFVDELGIAADTKTVTGVALIVIQSVLTAALAIMIVVNAIIGMIRENPHRKRQREEEEKMRDADLTPLDPRNSMLSGYGPDGKGAYSKTPQSDGHYYNDTPMPLHSMTPAPEYNHSRNVSQHSLASQQQNLISNSSPMGEVPDHQRMSGNYDDYRHQDQNEPVAVARVY